MKLKLLKAWGMAKAGDTLPDVPRGTAIELVRRNVAVEIAAPVATPAAPASVSKRKK